MNMKDKEKDNLYCPIHCLCHFALPYITYKSNSFDGVNRLQLKCAFNTDY